MDEQSEEGQLQLGNGIQLSFADDKAIQSLKDVKAEEQLQTLFQDVDQQLDECERVIGHWQPSHKFLSLYSKLDELSDVIEELDSKTMDLIGNSAKQLNKELDEILRRMQTLKFVNYDKNKIDYLYELLEKGMESETHVDVVLDRLKTLEKIHKGSPNIEGSIKTATERQKLIDVTLRREDQEIQKTKRAFLESMQEIQLQLREVTILQKA